MNEYVYKLNLDCFDKIKCFKNSVVGWTPEYFSYLGYIVSYGYPTRTHTHTRGNSIAHV